MYLQDELTATSVKTGFTNATVVDEEVRSTFTILSMAIYFYLICLFICLALTMLNFFCLKHGDYTRRQINQDRMIFGDFSVNSEPIFFKFYKGHFLFKS